MKNIKVIGIGDKIISAINMIYEYCSLDIELIHINTAKDVYNELKIDNKVIIGEKTAKWVGASKDVFKGQESVVESKDKIISIFKGSDMVILVAGMGEGTGTGATPKIAEISKELGIPTIAIGVPTVVDAASIVSDTINYLYDHFAYQAASTHNPASKLTANVNYLKLSQKFKINKEEKEKILGMVGTLSETETKELIYEILNTIGYNLMVTPKEEDFVITKLSEVISSGLNKALHKQITK